MKVTIDLKKSVEENASEYYDRAKKAKKKLQGAEKAVELAIKKKEKQDKEKEKQQELEQQKLQEKNRKKNWYEKFKWFFTTNNFLVIAGKDATTNEEVIKKYAEKDDYVFHTDMSGSPFAVLKTDKKEPADIDFQETAIFTGSNSKAWSQGISSVSVFKVKPEQVTKEAKAGEYIKKGSFMVYGKREEYNIKPELAVGIKEDVPMTGPVTAVKKHCEKKIAIQQGNEKKEKIANLIMKKLGLKTNDDILGNLPQGKFKTKNL